MGEVTFLYCWLIELSFTVWYASIFRTLPWRLPQKFWNSLLNMIFNWREGQTTEQFFLFADQTKSSTSIFCSHIKAADAVGSLNIESLFYWCIYFVFLFLWTCTAEIQLHNLLKRTICGFAIIFWTTIHVFFNLTSCIIPCQRSYCSVVSWSEICIMKCKMPHWEVMFHSSICKNVFPKPPLLRCL